MRTTLCTENALVRKPLNFTLDAETYYYVPAQLVNTFVFRRRSKFVSTGRRVIEYRLSFGGFFVRDDRCHSPENRKSTACPSRYTYTSLAKLFSDLYPIFFYPFVKRVIAIRRDVIDRRPSDILNGNSYLNINSKIYIYIYRRNLDSRDPSNNSCG